jgi:hypothetical protein
VFCETHPAACDLGLLYAESPFGNTDKWDLLHGNGKKCPKKKAIGMLFFVSFRY